MSTPQRLKPPTIAAPKLQYHHAHRTLTARRPWWLINALMIGVSTSVAAHLTLGFVEFTVPDFKLAKQQDKGLDIVLVNARHTTKPKDPQALAQANLDGGGNNDSKALPTSPLPPQHADQSGDALLETQKRVQQLESRQRQLATQALSNNTVQVDRSPPENNPSPDPQNLAALDLIDQMKAMNQREAAIERAMQEYAQRPRKSFVGARTAEYRFAQYAENWRKKIERVGELNFPKTARSKLYGSLLVSVEIGQDGTVLRAQVDRSSGDQALDNHALRIVQLAGRFAPFPPDIRKDTDVLVITRTWTFINEKVTTQ